MHEPVRFPLDLPGAAAPTEAELLEATARGEVDAFVELRGRLRRMVDAVCRSLLGREGEEDCEQEVFVRVWQKAPLYDRGRGPGRAWVATVARNVGLNLRVRAELQEAVQPEPTVEPVNIVDRLWLEGALARLPPQERRVLELTYEADLTQTQIAALTGVPLGSVKTWTRRGLHRLAEQLGEGHR